MLNIRVGLGFLLGLRPSQRRDHADAAYRVSDVRLGVLNPLRVGELPGEGELIAREAPGIDVVEAGDPHHRVDAGLALEEPATTFTSSFVELSIAKELRF